MPLTLALLLCQLGLATAVLAQACEHRHASLGERRLFSLRALAAGVLFIGVIVGWLAAPVVGGGRAQFLAFTAVELELLTSISNLLRAIGCWAILGIGILSLKRFGGPYCGGSDLMTLQVSLSMAIAASTSSPVWQLGASGYLCIQLCLSYWQSGWVKLINPYWRNGTALREVFAFTHYPVSEATRGWAQHPRLLWVMGWAIMLVEFLFPLSLYYSFTLYAALLFMGIFHLANAWFFGFNRFFWIWLVAYPVVIAWQPIMAEFMRR
ncbi:MAG: HTTM domain-containing protein [Moraxellaceae bacterium]|nr:MAG: HTTM domain-containing protein [Moraxellaceae bacterium]